MCQYFIIVHFQLLSSVSLSIVVSDFWRKSPQTQTGLCLWTVLWGFHPQASSFYQQQILAVFLVRTKTLLHFLYYRPTYIVVTYNLLLKILTSLLHLLDLE